MKEKKSRNIPLLYAIYCLEGMVFYASIATLYRQAVGVSVFQITIIESISLVLSLILEIPWGVIADRIGYKKTLIICYVLFFVSKIIFWRADGFGMFLVERIILSVVISGFSGVDVSMLYLSCDKDKFQKICAVQSNFETAGVLFSTVIFTLFIKSNYRLAAFLTVITYGIAAFVSFFLVEVKNDEEEEKPNLKVFVRELKTALTNKYLMIFIFAGCCLANVYQTGTVFLSQVKYISVGMTESSIGVVYIIMTALGMLGGFSHKITNKLGVLKTGVLMFAVSALACFTVAFTDSAVLSVISVLAIYIAMYIYRPMGTNLENKQITTDNRATALSINALITDSVAVMANLIFGKLADISLAGSFCFGGGLCVMGLMLFAVWYFMRGRAIKN
ncbi:MAG: MFS transporter [Clostridia bacterium]|nr:MFS transporter [Clostridia bacterium]